MELRDSVAGDERYRLHMEAPATPDSERRMILRPNLRSHRRLFSAVTSLHQLVRSLQRDATAVDRHPEDD